MGSGRVHMGKGRTIKTLTFAGMCTYIWNMYMYGTCITLGMYVAGMHACMD